MIFFRQKLEEVITLPEPPVDDLTEAYEVEEITRLRTPEQVQSVRDHDQEPYYAIRKVCEENNLDFHDGEFTPIPLLICIPTTPTVLSSISCSNCLFFKLIN